MSRKLKVIVNAIPAANPVTGIGRYVLDLYAALEEQAGGELEVHYFDGRGISRRPPSGPKDLQSFSRLGRWYWKLPLAMALPIRLALHQRRERLFGRLSEGMDLYHETAFFPFKPAPGVKIVQTVQDLSVQFHPQWHPAERVAYANRYFGPRLSWASRILCISDFTRRELLRFDPSVQERTSVTLLGADRRFKPASGQEQQRVRERYNLPPRYVLFVGSGDPRKNSRILGEVIARGRVPCEVVCAGWGGWLDEGAGGRVRMLGYLPDEDLPALYTAATAFAFPSHYEGFGLPVLEAMACGCPVVVPRAHSMPEVVGEAGIYYGAPGDVDGLERSLQALIADPTRGAALSAAGIARAERFDWRETARQTLAAFAMAT